MRIAREAAGRDDGAMLLTCQAGYEVFLAREAEEGGLRVAERGPGWVRAAREARATSNVQEQVGAGSSAHRCVVPDLAFAHLGLVDPVEITGESVNALAQGVADFFLKSLQGERIEAAWPSVWAGPQEVVGLGRRVGAVEAAFGEMLKKRLSRVAKLAVRGDYVQRATSNIEGATSSDQAAGIEAGGRSKSAPLQAVERRGAGTTRGLFVYFTDFRRAWVAREAWSGGQRRMADDERAPSRSFLKTEEAYGVLGREPQAGETVADLGAAPGGWSFSAAKRGARVVAVDNGPLKGGALGHPLIEHRREDAFKFSPAEGEVFDWLFCDLVEEPHHVLRGIVAPWLKRGWCRRFVVNLKFGRVDPVALLRELRGPGSVCSRHADVFQVRHLFHDREEFTVVGEARGTK